MMDLFAENSMHEETDFAGTLEPDKHLRLSPATRDTLRYNPAV